MGQSSKYSCRQFIRQLSNITGVIGLLPLATQQQSLTDHICRKGKSNLASLPLMS
jgi:hypothetical protein